MDEYQNLNPNNSLDRSRRTQFIFTVGLLFAQGLGLTAVILTGVWLGHFHKGFAWQSDPTREFNYHPLCMVIGLVFLYGNSILVYRVFRNDNKKVIKIVHAVLHLLALAFTSFGLKTVFDSHNLHTPDAIPNMYSLHSWLGIITVVLFGLQWVFGFCLFLLPCAPVALRSLYKPSHVFWGVAIFILAIATCLMGITEKNLFSNEGYHDKNEESIISNTLGLLLVTFGVVVIWMVTTESFRRNPQPEEESLQLQK